MSRGSIRYCSRPRVTVCTIRRRNELTLELNCPLVRRRHVHHSRHVQQQLSFGAIDPDVPESESVETALDDGRATDQPQQNIGCRVVALDDRQRQQVHDRLRHGSSRPATLERATRTDVVRRKRDPPIEGEPSLRHLFQDFDGDRQLDDARHGKPFVAADIDIYAGFDVDERHANLSARAGGETLEGR